MGRLTRAPNMSAGLLADGKIDYEKIVTHRVSLENIHEGFELMKQKQSLKVLVFPSAEEDCTS